MTRLKPRWLLGPLTLLTLCSLSISGCHKPLPEPIDASISVKCDPKLQACVPVTQGFVMDYGRLYEDLIRTQAKLAACQSK